MKKGLLTAHLQAMAAISGPKNELRLGVSYEQNLKTFKMFSRS
jgi:hypothetical protein